MSRIRDRIVEFRRVKAAELQAHPRNWRVHPAAQRRALAEVLDEIGYADALVARRLADGSLELIDGHLRAETTPNVEVPVLIVDLDEREAALLLAVHDPLSAMADTDAVMLQTLLDAVDAERVNVAGILGDLLPGDHADGTTPEPTLDDLFQIVVECRNEQEQRELFDRLHGEGRKCRLLTL
jgi:ParB-like chromosome segregation protein Spo0J